MGSVSGLSVASGAAASRPDGYALPPRGGPGSALGGGASSSGRAAIAALGGSLGGMHSGHSGHQHLEVAVRSAEVRYSKPLSTPIFTLSLRDGLGRLLELPVDTHPGHYRKETSIIHSSAVVRLATSLRQVPPGAVLFVEIKHWKSDKRRFSTLAWAAAALDTLVDAGPVAARVGGSVKRWRWWWGAWMVVVAVVVAPPWRCILFSHLPAALPSPRCLHRCGAAPWTCRCTGSRWSWTCARPSA